MHNYNSQLKASVWRVLAWCLSVISQSLEFIKNPLYDVYNCVVCLHFDNILKVHDQDPTRNHDEADTLRQDLLQIITNLVKDGDDEQIKLVTSQQHLQVFVY